MPVRRAEYYNYSRVDNLQRVSLFAFNLMIRLDMTCSRTDSMLL